MRWFAILVWFSLITGTAATAAGQPFASREDMVAFVDEHMLKRAFGPLIRRFDGSDEYSDVDISNVETRLRQVYSLDFTDAVRLRHREMENGFHEEVLTYWREGGSYIFLYIFSHEAPDGIHILTFALNSRAENVLPLFQ